jgi:excisionase family DNA binding protein
MNGMALEQQPYGIGADPDEVLTIQQAASVLKVSYSHMLRLVRGEITGMPAIHHVRAGRSLRVRRGALKDWIRLVEKLEVEGPVQQRA